MNSNIDLGRIIRLLLMQTKLIAAICLIGLAVCSILTFQQQENTE